MIMTEREQRLCRQLQALPSSHGYRYTEQSSSALQEILFRSLANDNQQYLSGLFQNKVPQSGQEWILRDAQGASDGAEYTEAARGKACGHIFKNGEATYRCKTCSLDDTCVLCSKCFEGSDHQGHVVYVSISPGNSGCCDCGDTEAWRIPVSCAIHTATPSTAKGKEHEPPPLPTDLTESVQRTIGRAMDYMCDVLSCSPEQLRTPKTEESIREDERMSRLASRWYGDGDLVDEEPEFALVLWNDEKHTVHEVEDQVARACKKERAFGTAKAMETDDWGRSVVIYHKSVHRLLRIAKIIEQIKITVTIRSSRDTFREQMCSNIIQWLVDLSGCSIGHDNHILKNTICTEMLKPWRCGSQATNAQIGRDGIDDHEVDDMLGSTVSSHRVLMFAQLHGRTADLADSDSDDDEATNMGIRRIREAMDEDEDEEEEEDAPEAGTRDAPGPVDDSMDLDQDVTSSDPDGDMDMRLTTEMEDTLEHSEATIAGYPPPPPPPPPPRGERRSARTSSGSDDSQATIPRARPVPPISDLIIPKTPRLNANMIIEQTERQCAVKRPKKAPWYWLDQPFRETNVPPQEDIRQRTRLDWLILYDLRLWKKARVDLRDLYISTVVTVPEFKRILGLRFAGLYTYLAQLYLIADREHDHSIIYLSLQMLTTPSITREIVDKGGFLTNLIAILYTFLTTRQVSHPWDVSTNATLAFDAGSVQNRRMYHFFMDLKHLFASEYVQEKLRTDERYVLQFLDLVKLPQGICPNVRAIGEHIEYETDAWISASLLTREINRLCRQFTEAFKWQRGEDASHIARVIRVFAKATILICVGAERTRFYQAEIKNEVRFKLFSKLEPGLISRAGVYDGDLEKHSTVNFTIEREPISFHHALHYTLSWLIDGAKSMTRSELRGLLEFRYSEFQDADVEGRLIPILDADTYLLALFDFPLRVCAWLAQMKAGMWVRNGLSLRHQMSTYRGVAQRDLAHSRDIFLLQTAMVTVDPSRILASMVDRYSLGSWMRGAYQISPGFDEGQTVDLCEDMIHLLIVILSDRTSLRPIEEEPRPLSVAIRRDITHILCFKPLSYSELCGRLADKFQDLDEFSEILEEMTNFKAPEGLNDSGTFELKEECIEEIDPYIAHYSKNQRDEAETAYKTFRAKKLGRPLSEMVYEPQLKPIQSGVFASLNQFCRTAVFAQIIYYMLGFALYSREHMKEIKPTRVEALLQVVLHLMLAAVSEDSLDDATTAGGPPNSFIYNCMLREARVEPNHPSTIFKQLQCLLDMEEYQACYPKINLILTRIRQKCPLLYAAMSNNQDISIDRTASASPASTTAEDPETKKRQALDRQARVMAQFQKQQAAFMQNQSTIDWGDIDDEETDDMDESIEQQKQWKYPSGNCILCQEETNDQRLYGTFALIMNSNVFRQTNLEDPDWLGEVAATPTSLDHSAEHIRPFGVSGMNRGQIRKLGSEGQEVFTERQGLGKGFPASHCMKGPISVGCGHIMHFSCFELYYAATQRRQSSHIVRNHPERLEFNEFVCPLCKALGNTFMPIIWKGKDELYPGAVQTGETFKEWLSSGVGPMVSRLHKQAIRTSDDAKSTFRKHSELFADYIAKSTIPPLAGRLSRLAQPNQSEPLSPTNPRRASMPGVFPEDDHPRVLSPGQATARTQGATNLTDELTLIHTRIRDTIVKNKLNLESRFNFDNIIMEYTDALARTLGFSIAATEIAARGQASEPGAILLDKISPLTLTHLRILSETTSSYLALGALRNPSHSRAQQEFYDTYTRQLMQLFGGHRQIYGYQDYQPWSKTQVPITAALANDPFVFLSECCLYLIPALNVEVHHIVHLCYLLELVKVTFAICLSIRNGKLPNPSLPFADGKDQIPEENLAAFNGFLEHINCLQNRSYPSRQPVVSSMDQLKMICALVSTYALPFLRKTAIFLHVRYGVDFPKNNYADMDLSETERLTKLLRLPTLAEMFAALPAEPRREEEATELECIVSGWVQHWQYMRETSPYRQASVEGLRPGHPGIFELIGLPKNYDTLIDEMMRRKCPTTGKDLSDPCICLFCGDIFCSQANCCHKDGLGGANQHLAKCNNNVGLYIHIRKCTLLYLHSRNGSWLHAPYLDKYGEVDPGLRRSKMLFLNQKRYDALLRTVWLNHGVPTAVARKLEADHNNGGWETV